MEVIDHREKGFPTDLESRLNAIASAVNVEFKSISLCCLDDSFVMAKELREKVIDIAGEGLRIPEISNFDSYCHKVLVPIASVAEENIIFEDMPSAYKITEAGKLYGRPIAAFSLRYAGEHEISMFEVLGQTNSSGKSRGPYNRIRILELANADDVRFTDLKKELGIPEQSLLTHLKALKKVGYIDFLTLGGHLGTSSYNYQYVDGKDLDEIKPIDRTRKLPRIIVKKLKELGEADALTILHYLKPLGYTSRLVINMMLSGLESQGYVKRTDWERNSYSKVNVLDQGKQFLDEYVAKVRDALDNGPALTEMNEVYDGMFDDGEATRMWLRPCIQIYARVSPNMNRRSRHEITEEIYQFLVKNPGARPTEMIDYFERRVDNGLRILFAQGRVRREKDKKASRYFAVT